MSSFRSSGLEHTSTTLIGMQDYLLLWLGLGLRTGDALIGMVEYNFTNKLRAGYAYDFTTSSIGNYSNGSHEVMISFDFGEDVLIKKTSPRYF